MKNALAVLVLLFSTLTAFAQNLPTDFVLVPINPGVVSGANGAQWTTTLWAFNLNDQPVGLNCTDVHTCQLVQPNVTVAVPGPVGAAHPGFFIRAQVLQPTTATLAPVTDTPWLELRTVDSRTAPHSAGTHLPLPHRKDFTGTVSFPQIPLNGHSRLKLRVYGFEDFTAGLTIWELNQVDPPGVLQLGPIYLQNQTVSLTGSVAGSVPSYAEVDLPDNLPVSALYVSLASPDQLSKLMWGFVTITDNVSQEVTIATATYPTLFR
jgi:hypothetical protein